MILWNFFRNDQKFYSWTLWDKVEVNLLLGILMIDKDFINQVCLKKARLISLPNKAISKCKKIFINLTSNSYFKESITVSLELTSIVKKYTSSVKIKKCHKV